MTPVSPTPLPNTWEAVKQVEERLANTSKPHTQRHTVRETPSNNSISSFEDALNRYNGSPNAKKSTEKENERINDELRWQYL